MYELIIIKSKYPCIPKTLFSNRILKLLFFFIFSLRLPCNYKLLKPKEMLPDTRFF